ncbi:hypothetical protein ACP70R_010951 [Stipagrostis hirtigluma subsp. patula]
MELSAAGEHDASGSGKRRRSLKRSLEYPCVSRLRHRRLLAYLWVHRKDKSFASVALETGFFFDVEHLVGLARLGRWLDAMNYISSFAPSSHVFGDEGQVLVNFVHMHNVLDGIATGRDHGTFYAELHENYLKKNPKAPPGDVKLGHIMLSLRDNPKLRASINWDLVRHKAAEIIKDLIAQVPEFNELLRIPNCLTRPHNILPIGFSSSRVKRHVKGVDRLQASDIARFDLQKKKRLPSSGHCLETISCGPSSQAIAKLADVLAVSVQAGICRLPRDHFPLSYPSQEDGVLDAPVPRPICNRITSPAKSFGIASETNASN